MAVPLFHCNYTTLIPLHSRSSPSFEHTASHIAHENDQSETGWVLHVPFQSEDDPSSLPPSHCLTKCKIDLGFKTTLLRYSASRRIVLPSPAFLPPIGVPDVHRQAVRQHEHLQRHTDSPAPRRLPSLHIAGQHPAPPVPIPAITSSAVPPTYRQISLTCAIQTPPLSVRPPPHRCPPERDSMFLDGILLYLYPYCT
jgi:hypothetical protein